MRIHYGDRAVIHNVLYENITVEYSRFDRPSVYQHSDDAVYLPEDKPACPEFIKGWMYRNMWSTDGIFGNVYDVTYRNIDVYTDDGMAEPGAFFNGADESHTFNRITLENIRVNGQKKDIGVGRNEFTGEIRIS